METAKKSLNREVNSQTGPWRSGGWRNYDPISPNQRRAVLRYLNKRTRENYPAEDDEPGFISSRDVQEYELSANELRVLDADFALYKGYFKDGDHLVIMVEYFNSYDELPGRIARFRMRKGRIFDDEQRGWKWWFEDIKRR